MSSYPSRRDLIRQRDLRKPRPNCPCGEVSHDPAHMQHMPIPPAGHPSRI